MKRQLIPTPEIIAEHQRLSGIMRESVYSVDFPFGVVAPTRARIEEIERRYAMPSNAQAVRS